ncbi:glycosyltransferase [Adhaeribacter rhizoryzae]|uniref:Glycosyltransferase n=1 Tax=Adhaeribacter rhizoryzae TaxID=2607907 RepID=A0A5M6DLB5_9BACT|nr:glycosyltransferase [Adhaeribacter rhizoryzae]KAA5548328.1 glycosyltransferase [Adhaeribacter rhizoryzae]
MSKKVAVFATHDFGGAGESAYRIAKAIQKLGYESKLIVKHKAKSDSLVCQVAQINKPEPIVKRASNRILKIFSNNQKNEELLLDKNYHFFNIDESQVSTSSVSVLNALPFKPDIILLAWVTGFINTELAYKLQKETGAQVYWLMTDMAPITGGCHYAWDCKGYTRDCSNCPAILTEKYKDRAKQNLLFKRSFIEASNIKVIAGSGWTLNQAKASSLFKNQNYIPLINGLIDFNIFNNANRNIAKQVFHVQKDFKIIFSGATYTGEKRKGISELIQSLQKLYQLQTDEENGRIKILVAGNQLDENELVKQIPFDIIPIDFIKDERLLSLAYQAADAFICSSLEDSGPMMVNEALACGTPVVGFEMGLLHNMIQNGKNGFKVPLGDTTALARAIRSILSLTETEFQTCSANAIKIVEENASISSLERLMLELSKEI